MKAKALPTTPAKKRCSKTITINRQKKLEMSFSPLDQQQVYRDTEMKMHKACDQMQVLLSKINDLQQRHRRAVHHNQQTFMQTYKMQINVLQGVYNMYYMYCSQKAEVLVKLEDQMTASEE